MLRRILHVDMDAFYASVEQRDFPQLKGKPVIVAGSDRHRGVVAAASYEARRYGIHSAMPTAVAHRLCPEVIRQPVRMEVYKDVSLQIRELFWALTDLVEPLSLDEAFLDVSKTCHENQVTATRVAYQLKQDIKKTTGLTASAGVGPNKFVAKVASDYRKPDGLTVVPPDQVTEFLHPLSIKRVWGIGPVTAHRLNELGIHTIADLHAQSLERLVELFGKAGLSYHQLARGQDNRAVTPHREPKSVSQETTFSNDVSDPTELHAAIGNQAERVAHRLARANLQGTTVTLKLRYDDFTTITRSHTAGLTDQAEEIAAQALSLLEKTEFPQRRVRLVGVGVSGLLHNDRPIQLRLF